MRGTNAVVLGLGAMVLAVGGCDTMEGRSDGPVGATPPDASDAKATPDGAVCEQLAAAAWAELDSYLQSTSALACAVDSDCVHLPPPGSVTCVAACGLTVGAAAASAVTGASTSLCDPYVAAGCPDIILPCLATHPVCDQGTCTSRLGASSDAEIDAGTPDVASSVDTSVVPDVPSDATPSDASDAKAAPDAAVCDQLAAAAQTQVASYLESAYSLACQVDADCSFLEPRSLSCFAVCGNVVVRTADLSAITADVGGACDAYFGAGCPEKAPPCPYGRPVCDHGTCARGPVPGGASGSIDAAVDAGPANVTLDGGSG